MKKLNTLVVAMLVAGASMAQSNWTIDKAHTQVGFSASHMVVSEVEGYFKDYDATITSTADDFTGAKIDFTAKTASVNTGNEGRDKHLRGDDAGKENDFFGSAKYPDLKFSGTLVKEGGKYLLKGNLTIRDVTKSVAFDVNYGGQVKGFRGLVAGFKITGKINRKDYGLKFDYKLEGGGLVVGEEVEIKVKVELNKQA